jgi:hypothetical protein
LASRAKIQQQQADMDAVALTRAATVQKMRQLAHDRTIKLTDMKQVHETSLLALVVLVDAAAATTTTTAASPSNNNADNKNTNEIVSSRSTAEALEREINSLLFDWDAMPQLIQDKAQLYLDRAKEMATRNDELLLHLETRNQEPMDPSPPHGDNTMGCGGNSLEEEAAV